MDGMLVLSVAHWAAWHVKPQRYDVDSFLGGRAETVARKDSAALREHCGMLARQSGVADGGDHCAVACTFGNLANAHGGLGDPGTARGMLQRALSIKESHYGAECYAVAISTWISPTRTTTWATPARRGTCYSRC